jgi:regulator of replication initiation timing
MALIKKRGSLYFSELQRVKELLEKTNMRLEAEQAKVISLINLNQVLENENKKLKNELSNERNYNN